MSRRMLILISYLIFSFNLSAQTDVEVADAIYENREASLGKVLEAANLYAQEAAKIAAGSEKNILLTKKAKALYYYADNSSTSEVKIKYFEEAMASAVVVVTNLKSTLKSIATGLTEQEKSELALAYYFYGVSLGKWGETKGVTKSLTNWPELKTVMNLIIELGRSSIESYGAYRTLGRAYFKLPFPLGSNKTSFEYLDKAFNGTKVAEQDLSTHGLNNIYYAEILYKQDYKTRGCQILKNFINADISTLNVDRKPESKKEVALAKEKFADLGCK